MSKQVIKLTNKKLKEMYRQSKDANLVNLYTNGIHQLLNIQLLYFDAIEDILKNGDCWFKGQSSISTQRKSHSTLWRDTSNRISLREKSN